MHSGDPYQVVDIDDEHHNAEKEQANQRENCLGLNWTYSVSVAGVVDLKCKVSNVTNETENREDEVPEKS